MQHVDALDLQQPQAPVLAGATAGCEAMASDGSDPPHHKYLRHTFPQQLISPAKRQANTQTGLYTMEQDASVGPAYVTHGPLAANFFSNNGQSNNF